VGTIVILGTIFTGIVQIIRAFKNTKKEENE
jgi:hypothetical protein